MALSFARMQTDSREINQLQSNIGKVVNDIARVPINNGILLTNIPLVTGSNNIYTTLPIALNGWFIADIDGAAAIYRETSDDPKILVLNTSADVTVNIFVF